MIEDRADSSLASGQWSMQSARTASALPEENRRPGAAEHFELSRAPEDWTIPDLAGAGLTIFHSLAASEEIWQQASKTCSCSAFQTFEWVSTWFDTVGVATGVNACLVHVTTRGGETLLLLPLALTLKGSVRSLEFLGGDLTDYNLPLINPKRAIGTIDMARLWSNILARLPRVDLVRLTRMPLAFDGVPNPLASLPGLKPHTNAYGASLPDNFAAFAAARSTQFFSQNRRYRRRLEKIAPVRVAFPEAEAERLAITRFLLEHKSRWQQAAGLSDTLAQDARVAFYERMTGAPMREGSISVAGLWVGDELVAGLWGVIFRGRYAFLITTYRADWSRLSVGRLLIESVIQMCIARGDLTVFDLTVGEEGYKADWADHTLPLYRYQAARTLRGRLILALWHARERVKGWPGLRRSVRAAATFRHRLRNRT
ncbi:GNAT family N-acetyltransferase [Methylobacterium planeticum]|uniref:GNAT family N-acetyltransferase n=1 Tax=Methylobacterium planeticum TaxID=2615211 RepID=A0A6N6MW80_9HYPH|nr:GNAT family N-acetyltransferase [Methylobacterium planeticum]KAB1074049.1 GNAT family N-acetyltransferase [Methylobacterium planeticum]